MFFIPDISALCSIENGTLLTKPTGPQSKVDRKHNNSHLLFLVGEQNGITDKDKAFGLDKQWEEGKCQPSSAKRILQREEVFESFLALLMIASWNKHALALVLLPKNLPLLCH